MFHVIVEVFGDVTANAANIVPESAFFALAHSKTRVVDLASHASITFLCGDVPERTLRTAHTTVTIEDGPVDGAVHTNFLHDVVYLIVWTTCASETVEVKVLWMVALDTCLPVEESACLFTYAPACLRVIYSTS